ncbi:L,D-transpeptidase family protein [Streptomyces sp. NRRL B-24720]|uniref:L,D-transpeptidase family protein n=1 Tax=Streptomyces sp. NRRL B-24720 TaxID=1476876 RepID=UPI0004C9BE28|nr:L,D-transpeptidase family protein [Streptomyces sp. NRRL B-24720]
MLSSSRKFPAALAAVGAILLASACSHPASDSPAAGVEAAAGSAAADEVTPSSSATTSASASASVSASASASAKASSSASASARASRGATTGGGSDDTGSTQTAAASPASDPDFPVPVTVGNATQLITVRTSGSYATVTAWAKGSSGWKSVLSASGRVGSNGIVDGATRRQNTSTTPSGTYTITEGFGVEAGGTTMPYTRVNSTHWWVEDPESKYYNSMHTGAGADFPLTESGDRGSEHLINYPTQYAKALVINFNRWPATPGRGAGIFLHVNGSGATAGCVSVPRATMDRIMTWIQPGAHPRIAIG